MPWALITAANCAASGAINGTGCLMSDSSVSTSTNCAPGMCSCSKSAPPEPISNIVTGLKAIWTVQSRIRRSDCPRCFASHSVSTRNSGWTKPSEVAVISAPASMQRAREFKRISRYSPPRQPEHVSMISRAFDIGVETMMWGSDYPHADGAWPESSKYIEEQFADLPTAVVHKITCENAGKFYRLIN